jgi:hypothetical protein
MHHREALAEALKELLPSQFHRDAVVAGGYAAKPELANDIDLWILGSAGDLEEVWSVTQDLGDHFKKHNITATFEVGSAEYPDVPLQVTPAKPILKFASTSVEMPPRAPRFGWMPVQMMFTPLQTVNELLETFDLSVHKHAWRLEEPLEMLASDDATWPSNPVMRITRFDTPERTYQRVQKLTARYGNDVAFNDIVKLTQASEIVKKLVLGERPSSVAA